MKSYELTYLISPDLKTEGAEGFVLEISDFLQKEGGFIIRAESPSPKTLSYEIKKQGAGFQVSLEFNLLPEKLKNLEEKIKKDSRVLRYLIVVKKATRKERERKIPGTSEIKPEESYEEKLKTEKKVELKDIEEKLEEILKE